MALTRQQMDDQVNQHFMYEATDDIDGVVGSFTENEEIRHEAVPSPVGPLTSLAQVRSYYEMLFPSVRGESVTPIMRLYGDDFLVDETLWTGEIIDGHWCLSDGMSGRASARLLHVFEFAADGKIKSERVWIDLAAIQQQLGAAEQPSDIAAAHR
ncbi:MAG TPA: nuclear transport factor 2 family protein [Thermoleophilaceae bacterium]